MSRFLKAAAFLLGVVLFVSCLVLGVRSAHQAGWLGEDTWIITPAVDAQIVSPTRPRVLIVTLATRDQARHAARAYWAACGCDAETVLASSTVEPAPWGFDRYHAFGFTVLVPASDGVVVRWFRDDKPIEMLVDRSDGTAEGFAIKRE